MVQEKEGRKGLPRTCAGSWVSILLGNLVLHAVVHPFGSPSKEFLHRRLHHVHRGCSIQREWFLLVQPCCQKETDAKVLVAM